MMQSPSHQTAAPPQLPPAQAAPASAKASPPAPAAPPAAVPKSSHPPLKCPMAGTFYRCPAPGSPPFVKHFAECACTCHRILVCYFYFLEELFGHQSTMVAKKFILQISNLKGLIVLSRKMDEMIILMEAIRTVLHGETGGKVADEYMLATDTLYLTVYLIDRFLSKHYIVKERLQLLGITCMMIASHHQ